MLRLINNYTYDSNYDYIKLFPNAVEQMNFFNSFDCITIVEDDYIRLDRESFVVEYSVDELINNGTNYVLFNNGYKDIFAFIIEKQYVAEFQTRIIFKVDVLQTYLFDVNINKSFIERKKCNLNEICEYDEGINFGEHVAVAEQVVHNKTNHYFAMFSGFRTDYPIKDRDNNLTNIVNVNISTDKPNTTIGGINYPLIFVPLSMVNTDVYAKYLKEQPNHLGVLVCPATTYDSQVIETEVLTKDSGDNIVAKKIQFTVATNIEPVAITGGSMTVSKASVTDFFPYTYYVLTDGESDPLIMHPQSCSSSITINGKIALSHTPVERYYPTYYKGLTDGTVYNITNSAVSILPSGNNSGLDQYSTSASQIEHNNKSTITNTLVGLGLAIGGGLTGNPIGVAGGVGMLASGMTSILGNMRRMEDLELTPNSIKSYGNPSTRIAFGTNKVKLIKYTIEDKYKQRILNFIDRYGNKYNNYGTIDLKSYKGYIKMIQPDLDCRIDTSIITEIINILERGVFIE